RERPVRGIPAISVFEAKQSTGRSRRIQHYWYMTAEYELRPPSLPSGAQRLSHYIQVISPPAEPGLGPPVNPMQYYLEPLRDFASVPSLKPWTADLVRRLAARKLVPAQALGTDGVRP